MGVSYAEAYASLSRGDGRAYREYCRQQGMKRCEECGSYNLPKDLKQVGAKQVCAGGCEVVGIGR